MGDDKLPLLFQDALAKQPLPKPLCLLQIHVLAGGRGDPESRIRHDQIQSELPKVIKGIIAQPTRVRSVKEGKLVPLQDEDKRIFFGSAMGCRDGMNFRPLIYAHGLKGFEFVALQPKVILAPDFLQESSQPLHHFRVAVHDQRLQFGQGGAFRSGRFVCPKDGTTQKQRLGAEVVVVRVSDKQVADAKEFHFGFEGGVGQIGGAINQDIGKEQGAGKTAPISLVVLTGAGA
jgi:hypothetical protein